MKPLIRHILLLNIALDIVILDQLSKWGITELALRPNTGEESVGIIDWITHAPERISFTQIEILPFFSLVMVWNQGISFGLLNQDGDIGAMILLILPLIITAIFLIWLFKTNSWLQGIAISLVIGGAIGNVIDRLRFGAVIDFLDFHIAGYHWPAFNLADSCVVVGIALLIFHSIFLEKAT